MYILPQQLYHVWFYSDTIAISKDNNDMARILKFNKRTQLQYPVDFDRTQRFIPMTDQINRL